MHLEFLLGEFLILSAVLWQWVTNELMGLPHFIGWIVCAEFIVSGIIVSQVKIVRKYLFGEWSSV